MVPRGLQQSINYAIGIGAHHSTEDFVRDAVIAVRVKQEARKNVVPLDGTDWVAVRGNSFPVKEQLKERFGARWNPEEKAWMVPRQFKMAAEVLVGNSDQVETLPGFA